MNPPAYRHTSYTSYVVVELFLQPRGLLMLPVEILQMFLEDVVEGAVHLAQVLQQLWEVDRKILELEVFKKIFFGN